MRKSDEYKEKTNPKATEDLRSQVCRKTTEGEPFPYNYTDSHHSVDTDKGSTKPPTQER